MGIEEILAEHFKEEGLREGREETVLEKDRTFVTNLIISTDFNDEKIASLVGVSVDFVKSLRTESEK